MAEAPERVSRAGALGISKPVGMYTELKPGKTRRYSQLSIENWKLKRYRGLIKLALESKHPDLADLVYQTVTLSSNKWAGKFGKYAMCYRKIEVDVLAGYNVTGHDKAMYRSFLMFLLAWVFERKHFSADVAINIWEGRGLDREILESIVSATMASPECMSIVV